MKKIAIFSILIFATSVVFAANPESDFAYKLSSDGESIIITGFKNNKKTYDIPSSIEEIPVKKVEAKFLGFAGVNEIAIKVPEGVTQFALSQNYGTPQSHIIITELPTSLEKCEIESQENKKNPKQFYISLKGSINNLDKLTQFKTIYVEFEEKNVIVRKEWQYGNSDFSGILYSFIGTNIEEVIFEEGLKIIGGFSLCSNLKKITLPSTVKKIEDRAFSFSANLSEVIIPDSVEKIYFDYGDIFNRTSIPLKIQARLRKLGYKGEFGNL